MVTQTKEHFLEVNEYKKLFKTKYAEQICSKITYLEVTLSNDDALNKELNIRITESISENMSFRVQFLCSENCLSMLSFRTIHNFLFLFSSVVMNHGQ